MKLGILGAGNIVQEFLSVSHLMENVKINALLSTERSLEKNTALANSYGIKQVYTDIDHLLLDEAVDTIYVALPNTLHYDYAKKALQAGKHVICEKPVTLKLSELEELERIADERDLILIEAITTLYLPTYKEVQAKLGQIGPVKFVNANFTQYSSRYDAFLAGERPPVFDPDLGGGALVDLNVYNIHLAVGLFGRPNDVFYYPNMSRQVDTSGLLVLNYPDKKIASIGSKDAHGLKQTIIEGEKGQIIIDGPNNSVDQILLNNEKIAEADQHRMIPEFNEFANIIATKDFETRDQQLTHSKQVVAILEQAIKSGQLYS